MASCFLLAACGGDDPDDARPQPTTTAPSTTQPQDPDEQALRSLAEDWFRAVRQAYMEDTDLADLEPLAVERYLAGVRDEIEAFRDSGNEARPGDRTRHEVLSVAVDGDAAVLVECVIDADLVLSSQGQVLNDEVQANLYETDALRDGDEWRLSGRRTLDEVDGSIECPAQ
ncbi:MAG TPA: hypothetical protein VFU19_05150 [Iamia sp.]|nr:hypothetical protein [Iamia sp.]